MSEYQITRFDQLSSTNQKIKELDDKNSLPEFSVIITHNQIEGRGQMGNSWESESGKNLTFSLKLKPEFLKAEDQFCMSKMVSVAIADSLNSIGISDVKVKWPNDIYVGNKKIAGILIENSIMGNVIDSCLIGIGLNVNQIDFKSDAPNPISIAQIVGNTLDLETFFETVLDNLKRSYNDLKQSAKTIGVKYENVMFWGDGQYHSFTDENEIFDAKIIGTDQYGRLIVQLKDSRKRIYAFKEVSYNID